MHEAQMHPENCFITLTYADEHLPETYSVSKPVWQTFMKKFRQRVIPKRVRFYACGEYGPETLRPHYHAVIFGYDFADKKLWKTTEQGNRLYTSELLEDIWSFGFCTLGDVTYESAGYVAQYVMKKQGGDQGRRHYLRTHPVTLQVVQVEPEFSLSSRRPGIGSTWFDKFKNDCFPSDFLVVDGKQHRVPQFYLKKLQEEELTPIKRRRKRNSLPRKADNTKDRLAVREEVKQARISKLKRIL